MRYLALHEILDIYRRIVEQSGGAMGIRDFGSLESALAQPRMTFDGQELYQTIIEKASALGYSIFMNHPFLDGNKRTAHAAMEMFLILNGYEIDAPIDEQEKIILQIASGELGREAWTAWLQSHVITWKG